MSEAARRGRRYPSTLPRAARMKRSGRAWPRVSGSSPGLPFGRLWPG